MSSYLNCLKRKFVLVSRSIIFVFSFLIFDCMVCGIEVFTGSSPADFSGYVPQRLSYADGIFTFKAGASGFLQSKEKYRLKMDSYLYRISGEFRLLKGKPARIYLGYIPYDDQGRQIRPSNVNVVLNTETRLAEAVHKGDRLIKLEDASKWQNRGAEKYLVFDAQDDYADLPNFNFRVIKKNSISRKKGYWTAELETPVGQDYAKGVKVREHQDGNAYMYNADIEWAERDWLQHVGILMGVSQKPGISSSTMLWKGTKAVSLVLLVLEGDENTVIQFKNLKIEGRE